MTAMLAASTLPATVAGLVERASDVTVVLRQHSRSYDPATGALSTTTTEHTVPAWVASHEVSAAEEGQAAGLRMEVLVPSVRLAATPVPGWEAVVAGETARVVRTARFPAAGTPALWRLLLER